MGESICIVLAIWWQCLAMPFDAVPKLVIREVERMLFATVGVESNPNASQLPHFYARPSEPSFGPEPSFFIRYFVHVLVIIVRPSFLGCQ